MSQSRSVGWLINWGQRGPPKWKPSGTGFSGRYRTSAGEFDGWVGVTDRGVVALVDAPPQMVASEQWDGRWSRLPIRRMNQTVSRFKNDAEEYVEDQVMANREYQSSEENAVDTTVVRNIDIKTDHAEMMRAMNDNVQFQASVQSAVGQVAELARALGEQLTAIEGNYASTIAALPEQVAAMLERQRDFYFRSARGTRFWTFNLAGQATANWAMAKATQDMRNFLFDMEHTLSKQFNALQQVSAQARMMFVHTVAQAFAPFLSAGQPQNKEVQQLFQRLLAPTLNGTK